MSVRWQVFLALLMVENIGSAASAIVTFNPDRNKIFLGEPIDLACHVDSMVEEDATYQWFKDGYWLHSGRTVSIPSADWSNSGNYECQTSTGEKSDSAQLEVYNGYVILQASPYVYEGDNLTLRCHHHPGYLAKQTIFYKNDEMVKGWGSEDELHINNIDVTSSSKYKCTKQVNHHLLYYQHTGEISVSVRELFSLPTIRLSQYSVTEGEPMTLICHTKLSPLRQNTVLQFAFYRDGQNIQEFSSSNKYEIPSSTHRDSGDYKCEVKTLNFQMKKMSTTLIVQVKRSSEQETFNQPETEETSKPGTNHFITAVYVTSLFLVLVLIFAGVNLLYRRFFQPVNHQPTKVVFEAPDEKKENIYVDPDMINGWRNCPPNAHKPAANKLVTENDFLVC